MILSNLVSVPVAALTSRFDVFICLLFLLFSKCSHVQCEFHTDHTDPICKGFWIDILITGKQVAHVVEWKNITLDFLEVTGINELKLIE